MSLCPEILRRRLIVEGLYGGADFDEQRVRLFLAGLSRHMGMTPIADTLIFSPDAVSDLHHGIGGFQPWAESGCSLYTWRERRLFTLDIYSCKEFTADSCLAYVDRTLHPEHLEWRLV